MSRSKWVVASELRLNPLLLDQIGGRGCYDSGGLLLPIKPITLYPHSNQPKMKTSMIAILVVLLCATPATANLRGLHLTNEQGGSATTSISSSNSNRNNSSFSNGSSATNSSSTDSTNSTDSSDSTILTGGLWAWLVVLVSAAATARSPMWVPRNFQLQWRTPIVTCAAKAGSWITAVPGTTRSARSQANIAKIILQTSARADTAAIPWVLLTPCITNAYHG